MVGADSHVKVDTAQGRMNESRIRKYTFLSVDGLPYLGYSGERDVALDRWSVGVRNSGNR